MQNKLSAGGISLRGGCAILILIHISNNNILGLASGAGTDTWLAQLFSLVTVAPLLLILSRLVRLMPGMDLFGMMDYLFGRFATVVLSALYFYYFITVAAIVRMYYAEFVQLVALINTPLIVILFSFFVVCTYLAKSGTQTLGKWSVFMVALAIAITVALTLLAIPNMEASHLQPMFSHSAGDIAQASYRFAVLPLGEAVILLTMTNHLDRKANPYKLFFIGTGISVVFFAVVFLRNCAVLGEMSMGAMNYTSYKAASVIHIGSIGTRVEALVAISFIMTGITKVSACLIAAAKSVKRVFSLPSANALIMSVAFFSIGLSAIVFNNIIEMFNFSDIYLYYAPVFQMGIPAVMWIVAEVKVRRDRPAGQVGLSKTP